MARRVFFSFHYQRDIWRANVVRNSDVVRSNYEPAGRFIDASLWEETKRRGEEAVRRLIDEGLVGTSVTAVLVGAETSQRPWVRYEIEQSIKRGNGLVGIQIHNIPDQNTQTDIAGANPFNAFPGVAAGVRTYDWKWNDGYRNLSTWIEQAAQQAGR